ncbi:MAG: hypothetical protein Q8Q24_02015, partial [bacterium]|nr:hypothetical protein [bacterium]
SDTKEEVFKLPRLSLSIASSLKDIDGGAKLGITLQLTSISFKETGKYILQVKANNIIVGSLDFMVNLLKEKKGKQINMPYRIVVSDYLYPSWYQYSQVETQKPLNEEYKMLGTFSQGTNWEKVFALGNEINKDLQITEQEIIDEVADFQK